MTDALMKRAAQLHQAGRLAEAADAYRDVLRGEPKRFDAHYALGVLSLQTGAFEEAQRIIGEALALNPGFAEGWCAHGMVLGRLNRSEQAIASFDRALALRPDFLEALSARAALLVKMNRPDEAVADYDRILASRPDHAVTWNNRGSLLMTMGKSEEALASFDRALSFNPKFREPLVNRATVLFDLKRFDAAIAAFDACLAVDPDHAIGWNNRGNALLAMMRLEEAIASYDKALALRPDFAQAAANREYALLELKHGTRCPPTYITDLFDEFSANYDENMLVTLKYRAHLHLRTLAERVLPPMTPSWRIFDLGSGTGLVGEAFKDLAAGGRLDGIDLSPRMIEAARKRAIYDDLIVGDLETVLAAPGRSYDLILAADTMIYFGELTAIFSGAARRLEPAGFYLFAVEAKHGEGWEHTAKNRFRHSEAYLRAEAARAGLAVAEMMECVLRHEGNEPVPGLAVALRKPG